MWEEWGSNMLDLGWRFFFPILVRLAVKGGRMVHRRNGGLIARPRGRGSFRGLRRHLRLRRAGRGIGDPTRTWRAVGERRNGSWSNGWVSDY